MEQIDGFHYHPAGVNVAKVQLGKKQHDFVVLVTDDPCASVRKAAGESLKEFVGEFYPIDQLEPAVFGHATPMTYVTADTIEDLRAAIQAQVEGSGRVHLELV